MALLDQTDPAVTIRKSSAAHILRRLCSAFAEKPNLESYRMAAKQREQARRTVDRLLHSCGPRHLG